MVIIGQGCLVEKPKVGESFSSSRVLFSHQGLESSCVQCHESDRPAPKNGIVHGNSKDCALCHVSTGWKDTSNAFGHSPLPTNCISCHENRRPTQTILSPPAQALNNHFTGQDCFSCHQVPMSTQGPFMFTHRSASLQQVTTCKNCHEANRLNASHYPGQDCAGCHSDTTTWKVSSGSPHPTNANITTCISCHETKRPISTVYPAPGGTVSGHFAGQDCFKCHNPKTTTLTTWVFNHTANGQARTTCLPCHTAKRPANHYGTQDCVSCHSPSTPWNTSGYTPHPTNSGLTSCNSCHNSNRPANTVYPAPGGTVTGHFTTQDCYSCHNPKTTTLTTWVFNHSANNQPRTTCLPCHTAKRPANHYGTQDCKNCHLPSNPWTTSTYTPHPTNTGLTSCNSCHNNERPTTTAYPAPGGTVTGHFTTQDCYSCHNPKTTTLTTWVFNHTANGQARTTCLPCHTAKRPANHYGTQDCVSCHNPASPWNVSGYSPHPTNNATLTSCNSCHTADRPINTVYPAPGGTVSGHFGTTDCYSCHKAKTTTAPTFTFTHNANGVVLNSCLPCHTAKKPTGVINKFDHAHSAVASTDCKSCHTSFTVWSGALYGHTPNPTTCTNCHTAQRPTTTINGFNHQTMGGTGDCASCHTSKTTWSGGNYSHSPAPTSCNSCHLADKPTTVINKMDHAHASASSQDCKACHTSFTVWSGGNFSHSPKPTSCLSCHTAQRPTTVINRFNHQTAGMGDCVSCHASTTVWSGGTYNHSPAPTSCNTCHSTNKPTGVVNKFDHAHSAVASTDCKQCHTSYTVWSGGHYGHTPNPTTCTNCHTSQRPTTTINGFNHQTMGGTGDCASCHTSKTTWSGGLFSHSPIPTSCTTCHASDRPANAIYPSPTQTVAGHYATPASSGAGKPGDCVNCHKAKSGSVTSFSWTHYSASNVKASTCIPCHLQKGKNEHGNNVQDCKNCHSSLSTWNN